MEESREEDDIKRKLRYLEEQVKDKEDYINFLTAKTPLDECGISAEKLRESLEELERIKEMAADIKKTIQDNDSAMNNVWPHLMNVMLNQCNLIHNL